MIVLTPEEMAKMDKRTIEAGYPGIILMEIAGRGVAVMASEKLSEGGKILVFAGKGNNGGDGFVAARYLDMWGYDVNVVLLGRVDDLKGSPEKNYQLCDLRKIRVLELPEIGMEQLQELIANSRLIIDSLLGTGLQGKVRGKYARIIELINQSNKKVLAVDIPSGINGRTGQIQGIAIKADFTVTMAFLKVGLLLYPGREFTGELRVIDLGMPESIVEGVGYNHYRIEKEEASNFLPSRPIKGHKGTFGKVSIVGGSPGMIGAPVLTGISALKTGAGLVKLAVPERLQSLVHSQNYELLSVGLKDNKQGISKQALPRIKQMIEESDILAVGPGLGRSEDINDIINEILINSDLPVVLDADGINMVQNLELLKEKSRLILTPHPGEMARLTGKSIKEINENRVNVAREFATDYKVYLVLKGAATVIALPDGDIYINSTGNQGMATAGSGDVLTGIIAGLLAQGAGICEGAILAPYLHGMAGDLAAEEKGSYSLLASDIFSCMNSAISRIKNK